MLHFGPIDIRTDIFVLLLSVIIMAVQLLLCFKVRSKHIRLLPVYLFSGLTVVFVVLGLILDGWDGFGLLVLALCSALILLACGVGFAVWWGIKKARRSDRE